MQEQIQPVGARCLILPYKAAEKSASGLVMENNSNTSGAPVRGTIMAVGDESKFKKGQDVMYTRYSSYRLVIITPEGEKDFILVDDEDCLAIVKSKTNATRSKKESKAS